MAILKRKDGRMEDRLTSQELVQLVRRVFAPGPTDHALAVLCDLPDRRCPDNPGWQVRRGMAREWTRHLGTSRAELGLGTVTLAWYPNVGGNNADLPDTCVPDTGGEPPREAANLAGRPAIPFAELLAGHSLILAPTELSATAPLKVAARRYPFRAATMPGFSPAMIPALRIDYTEVDRRVTLLKELCDRAESARLLFAIGDRRHELHFDLRHRTAHASGGLFPKNGVAGNLPSGEAYIVPYEGELPGDPSQTAGELPVQIGDEVVLYSVQGNRAADVLSEGPESLREAQRIRQEPAYANLAELGLGVLGDFGLAPVGSILLDEKLGLHVAFGRSDHFGGIVGPGDFSRPEAVVHLDRVYIPAAQPLVQVLEVRLLGPGLDRLVISQDRYTDLFK